MHRCDTHPKLLLYAIHVKIILTTGTPELRVFASKHRKLDLREPTLASVHEVRGGAIGVGEIRRAINIKVRRCGVIHTIGQDVSMGEIRPIITIPWLMFDAVPI
jgi:hypothetical protein